MCQVLGWTLVNSTVALAGYYFSAFTVDKRWMGRRRLQVQMHHSGMGQGSDEREAASQHGLSYRRLEIRRSSWCSCELIAVGFSR